MLIIPLENKPQWSRPPVITLGLILVNLLVFLLYQGNDDKLAMTALEHYHDYQLWPREQAAYIDYLQAHQPAQLEELKAVPDEEKVEIFSQLLVFDRGFDAWLRQQVWTASEDESLWRSQRETVESVRNRISYFAGGLTPAEARPVTFITSLFLHGGWDHLIGNMLFLFLFGFALETATRPLLYLGFYLLSGLAADGLHVLINWNSMTPVIGASGAISGLMGMYLALYRFRKIRFFYTVFFYFGEFRAPALLVLPLWLAKEIYGYFFIDSNTAYAAHAGGLLAGAGLMLLARRTHEDFAEHKASEDKAQSLEDDLKHIDRAMTSLDIPRAQRLIRQACQAYPADPRPWRLSYDLLRGQPRSPAFHQATFALLKHFAATDTPAAWHREINEVLADYARLAPAQQALTGPLCLALAVKFARQGNRASARPLAERAKTLGVQHPRLEALASGT